VVRAGRCLRAHAQPAGTMGRVQRGAHMRSATGAWRCVMEGGAREGGARCAMSAKHEVCYVAAMLPEMPARLRAAMASLRAVCHGAPRTMLFHGPTLAVRG